MKKLKLISMSLQLYFMCLSISLLRPLVCFLINKLPALSCKMIIYPCRIYESLLSRHKSAEKQFFCMVFSMME